MRICHASGLVALLLLAAVSGAARAADTTQLTADAVSDDAAKSQPAITELRKMGPTGLDALFTANDAAVNAHAKAAAMASLNPSKSAVDPNWLRLTAALDQVAGQKDAYFSHLYWYTDHAEATKAAAAVHKPILTLFMLGKLTDDLSCANSRFFRTTLYANTEVSGYLREHFILEWQSERPVPRITIDMGDGRKIVRTITGNSIHYVLDEKGRVVDAVPGLYGSKAFLTRLVDGEKEAKAVAALDDAGFLKSTAEYHAAANNLISAAWQQDVVSATPIPAGSTTTVSTVQDKSAELFEGVSKTKSLLSTYTVGAGVTFSVPTGGTTVLASSGVVPLTSFGSTSVGSSTTALTLSGSGSGITVYPTAAAAGAIPIGKGAVEMPVVSAIAPQPAPVMNPNAVDAGKAATLKWDAEKPMVAAVVPPAATDVQAFPPAAKAATLTVSKVKVERMMLSEIAQPAAGAAQPVLTGMPQPTGTAQTAAIAQPVSPVVPAAKDATDDLWNKISALHASGAALDGGSKALILAKNPALAAGMISISKSYVETPMIRLMRNLQGSIALDTVHNEYTIHPRIHEWLGAAKAPVDLKAFNERVYAELFLTPKSDPWLGLVPADTYSALDNEGVCPIDGTKN